MEHENQIQALPEAQTQGQEALEQGLAKRAETMQVVAKAQENLGHVGVGHEVHADPHGTLLLDRDLTELRTNGSQEDRHI